jgi:hypothetical protein
MLRKPIHFHARRDRIRPGGHQISQVQVQFRYTGLVINHDGSLLILSETVLFKIAHNVSTLSPTKLYQLFVNCKIE